MPGVADTIRRTRLSQDQKARKKDMEDLTRLVAEGRLHEADERQLETLQLMRELRESFISPSSEIAPADNTEIIEAVKQAMGEVVAKMPAISPAQDPSRPKMKHTSLADIVQSEDKIKISHGGKLGEDQAGTEDSTDKLEKLRKLKGQ